MHQRHVGFSKGLGGGVAQQVCVPLGIKAVRRLDGASHSVLFIVFGVVLKITRFQECYLVMRSEYEE